MSIKYCYQCGKTYLPKRNLATLFILPATLRCVTCQKKAPIAPKYVCHKECKRHFHLFYIFEKHYLISTETIQIELKPFVETILLAKKDNDYILWIDYLNDTLYQYILQIEVCDIYCISYFTNDNLV